LVCSTFDLFKIGVGPSSSHTMGPMTAACRFVEGLQARDRLRAVDCVEVDLYGSLALTGKGHATDRAIRLDLGGERRIGFQEARDLRFNQRERLPHHSNGMRFTATLTDGTQESAVYYSVGGGAVVDEAAVARNSPPEGVWDTPYPYASAAELLALAQKEGISIAERR
jgi:L-serine dehydratase